MSSPQSTRVLITHLGSNGGGPKFHYHLFAALLGRPHLEVHYLISKSADNKQSFLASKSPSIIIPTYTTKLGLILGLPMLLLSAIRLRRYIRKNQVSVVINSMESVYQGLIAHLAVPRKVKYVSCVHDAVDHPGDEHIIKKLSRWGERSRADEFVVFSNAVYQSLSRSGALRGRRIRQTVHGAFDGPAPLADVTTCDSSATDLIRIGFLGRLGKYKGLDLLAQSVRLLRARSLKVEGVVYGAGPEEYLADTRLGGELTWCIGWIEDDEISGILDTFDILALPYTEASQSGVVAYAMSRALPMVVTPVGGLPEQISAADCGIVAGSLAPTDFANALEKLVVDGDLRMRLSRNAWIASQTTFSWGRVGDDFATWLTES